MLLGREPGGSNDRGIRERTPVTSTVQCDRLQLRHENRLDTRVGGISSLHPILTDAKIPGWGQPPDIVSRVLEADCFALHS